MHQLRKRYPRFGRCASRGARVRFGPAISLTSVGNLRASHSPNIGTAGIAMLALVLPLVLLLVAVRLRTGVLAALLLLVLFVASV